MVLIHCWISRRRRFGFVGFSSEAEALKAVSMFQGSKLGGTKIKVELTKNPSKHFSRGRSRELSVPPPPTYRGQGGRSRSRSRLRSRFRHISPPLLRYQQRERERSPYRPPERSRSPYRPREREDQDHHITHHEDQDHAHRTGDAKGRDHFLPTVEEEERDQGHRLVNVIHIREGHDQTPELVTYITMIIVHVDEVCCLQSRPPTYF